MPPTSAHARQIVTKRVPNPGLAYVYPQNVPLHYRFVWREVVAGMRFWLASLCPHAKHAPVTGRMMEDDSDTSPPGNAPESLLPYDQWMEEAMRGVVSRALSHAVAEGLPGKHHFYITFRTDYPGVVIPPRLLAKYPDEMTIVLQHQFDRLHLDEEHQSFGVSLSFGGVPSALTIPLAAISAFVDPHVQYGLRFRITAPPQPEAPADGAPAAAVEDGQETPQVVSLDAFRRRRD